MITIRNSILAGLAFGILFGIFLYFRFGPDNAIIAGPISGFVFGLATYFFVTSKSVKKQTEIELDGKTVVHSGGANHFMKGEAVGGKLYLLDDRIVFKSHNFNVQNHGLEILLKDVKQIEFFNSLGLIPNGLKLLTGTGSSEKFVVNNRKHWQNEINKKIS